MPADQSAWYPAVSRAVRFWKPASFGRSKSGKLPVVPSHSGTQGPESAGFKESWSVRA